MPLIKWRERDVMPSPAEEHFAPWPKQSVSPAFARGKHLRVDTDYQGLQPKPSTFTDFKKDKEQSRVPCWGVSLTSPKLKQQQ